MPGFRLYRVVGRFFDHDVFAARLASSVSTLFGRKIGADQNKSSGCKAVSIIDLINYICPDAKRGRTESHSRSAKEPLLSPLPITLKDGSNVKYLIKAPPADAPAAAKKEGISKEKVSSYEISQLGAALSIGESPLPVGVAVKISK